MLWGHMASLQLTGSLLQVDCKDNSGRYALILTGGRTALMMAAGEGHKRIVQLLLDRGAEVMAALNRRGGGRVDRKGCLGEDPSGPRPHPPALGRQA